MSPGDPRPHWPTRSPSPSSSCSRTTGMQDVAQLSPDRCLADSAVADHPTGPAVRTVAERGTGRQARARQVCAGNSWANWLKAGFWVPWSSPPSSDGWSFCPDGAPAAHRRRRPARHWLPSRRRPTEATTTVMLNQNLSASPHLKDRRPAESAAGLWGPAPTHHGGPTGAVSEDLRPAPPVASPPR